MADIAINPVTRRVQFTGNTGTGPFAFTFNILADEDIAVYKNTTLLTLTTHYSVTTNANGTGSITLVAGQALISSDVLTIIGGRDLSRTTDFVTAGDLLASSLNEQLDSLVIMTQQLDEKVGRTIKTNPGDVYTDLELPTKDNRKGTVLGFNATSGDPEVGPTIADVSSLASITADIATLADIEDGTDATDAIQTVAGISSNVSTVAGISANVTTVAGNTSNINAVAADATDIGTVAGSISNVNTVAGIDSNITTVAGNTTNINTVAGNNSNITTVAGVSANVTTVAGISSDVTTVAGISSDVTTVAADGTDIGTVATNIADVNTVASNIATISAKVSKSGDTMTGDLTIQGNLTVSGTTITVDSATAQTIDLGDGDKMRFGDSNDAYIEWNGTYFDARSTGRFDLLSSGNDLRLSTATNVGLIVNHTGGTPAVQLYNSGVERLATTSTGVDITGTLTSDGLTVDGDVGIGLTAPTISEGYQIHVDAAGNGVWGGFGNSYLTSNYKFNSGNKFAGTGYASFVEMVPSTGAVTVKTSSASGTADATATMQSRLNIATNGDISFYEDTGTTAKFFWDASAESLGIGTTSPDRAIKIHKDNAYVWIADAAGGNVGFLGGSGANDGLIRLYEGTGHTAKVEIHSNADSYFNGGNVGIGTSSPSNILHVSGTSGTPVLLERTNGAACTIAFKGNATTNNPYLGANGNDLYFNTGTAEAMRIDSSGNVGIGESSPDGKIDIAVNGANERIHSVRPAGGSGSPQFGFKFRWGDDGDSPEIGLTHGGSYSNAGLYFDTMSGGSKVSAMRITSAGLVGIGTTSPDRPLHVTRGDGTGTVVKVGNTGTSSAAIEFSDTGTTDTVSIGSVGNDLTLKSDDGDISLNTTGDPATASLYVERGGNVGIGTTAPSGIFHVKDASSSFMFKDVSGNAELFIDGSNGDFAGGDYFNIVADSSPNLMFKQANTERMRIDSSGNLLVGMTSASATADGMYFDSSGFMAVSRSRPTANTSLVAQFNRKTTDGDIVQFHKDGTTVGSIGCDSVGLLVSNPRSNSYISLLADNQSNGIFFQDGTGITKTFSPYSARTGEFDLGHTGGKWKDLYLSGGVYLGGTGSANKLDDYEEGTFTASWGGSATAGTASGTFNGTYTKIGRVVYCTITLSACNLTGASGALQITGLPFSAASGNLKSGGTAYLEGVTPSFSYTPQTGSHVQLYVAGSSTTAQFRVGLSAQWDNYLSAASTFTSGGGSTYGTVSITYTT